MQVNEFQVNCKYFNKMIIISNSHTTWDNFTNNVRSTLVSSLNWHSRFDGLHEKIHFQEKRKRIRGKKNYFSRIEERNFVKVKQSLLTALYLPVKSVSPKKKKKPFSKIVFLHMATVSNWYILAYQWNVYITLECVTIDFERIPRWVEW